MREGSVKAAKLRMREVKEKFFLVSIDEDTGSLMRETYREDRGELLLLEERSHCSGEMADR